VPNLASVYVCLDSLLLSVVRFFGTRSGLKIRDSEKWANEPWRCPRDLPKLAGKLLRKNWTSAGNRASLAPLRERQKHSRGPAPPAPSLVRGFGGGGASRFNPTRDPNHVSQEAIIKQVPPGGLKAGSGACDAPTQTGRDHRVRNGGNQPHSVRGFLAGIVRKKLALSLLSEKPGEERVYRIVAKDVAPKRKG
jgi:hypothetical protein